MKLPTSELQVEGDPSSDFKLGSFFKTGEAALVSGQGWKTADALTPELGEWMRFVQKRLSLKRSPTYLAQKIIFAMIGTINGIAFNWAGFVAGKIYSEISAKKKTGKIVSLLCSNYVSAAIRFILDLPEKGKKQAEELQSAMTLPPTEATRVPLLTRQGDCSHPAGQGEEPLALATQNPEELTPQADPDILCQEESDHLTAQAAWAKQKVTIKKMLLNQLAQLKITVEELDAEDDWKQKWQASQREVRKTQRRLVESEKTIKEKMDAITALTDFYKANERLLRGERDLARENSQAEQQAREELQSKWVKEKAEFEEQLLLHE